MCRIEPTGSNVRVEQVVFAMFIDSLLILKTVQFPQIMSTKQKLIKRIQGGLVYA